LGSPLAHLLNKAQFDAVFAGAVINKTAHFALHYADIGNHLAARKDASAAGLSKQPEAAAAHGLAVGVVVPKRWARRAVTRNTIKRQVYAVSTACAHSLAKGHYVVRLKTEFSRTTFTSATSTALKCAVRAELQTLFLPKP
jgi:ribonuclease P protein component